MLELKVIDKLLSVKNNGCGGKCVIIGKSKGVLWEKRRTWLNEVWWS